MKFHIPAYNRVGGYINFFYLYDAMAGHGRPPLSMFSEWLHDFDGTERSASTGLHIDMPGWVGKGGAQVDTRRRYMLGLLLVQH